MTNLSISEKIALEEVFIVLDSRKVSKIEALKKYISFYRYMKMFIVNRGKISLVKS